MTYKRILFWAVFLTLAFWYFKSALPKSDKRNHRVDLSEMRASGPVKSTNLETATLGGGCFWCVEAVLERIKGVASVESGFSGGESGNPTYSEISKGNSGHAEVVQVEFDPDVLSYEELLTVFWELHDPTTLNRQGADRGTQYRSVIYYHDEAQRLAAEKSIASKDASGDLKRGIVTELGAVSRFLRCG